VECKDCSPAYYALALAVAEDDQVVKILAGMPVSQPDLFFAPIQLLTGPDGMPAHRHGAHLTGLGPAR
jgi:hypothetical protein